MALGVNMVRCATSKRACLGSLVLQIGPCQSALACWTKVRCVIREWASTLATGFWMG